MRRWASPCTASGGAPHSPNRASTTSETRRRPAEHLARPAGLSSLSLMRGSSHASSRSGPKASIPIAVNSTANTAEQRDPGPRVRRYAVDRRFPGSGGPEQDRRHHREQEHRHQRLAHPQPGGEHAVEGTGGRHARRSRPAWPGPAAPSASSCDAVDEHHRRRRAPPRAPAARPRSRRPCPGTAPARRGPRAAARRGRRCRPRSRTSGRRRGARRAAPSPRTGRARPAAGCPGRGRARTRRAGARSAPNGTICCDRHPRAGLDPQVLARDERAPRARGSCRGLAAARRRLAVDRLAGRGAPAARRGLPGGEHDLAVGERAGVLELVGREQHGAALAGRGPRPRASSTSRPSASSPAWGSSSSSSRGSRASATASARRRR